MRVFDRTGVRFHFPDDWTLDADDSITEWSATIESPGSAFFLFSMRSMEETPSDLVDEALEAMKEDYKDLEAEMLVTNLAGHPALGYDVDFTTVDAVTKSWIRCIDTEFGPLLILAQLAEHERAHFDEDMNTIWDSIAIDTE